MTWISRVGYFVVALVWNTAVLSVVLFLTGFIFDIVGSATGNERVRGDAYAVGLLATVSGFWFGLLAAVLSPLVKCNRCGARTMSLRSPFFVSLHSRKCPKCDSAA